MCLTDVLLFERSVHADLVPTIHYEQEVRFDLRYSSISELATLMGVTEYNLCNTHAGELNGLCAYKNDEEIHQRS
jgi:hypothetical protein